MPLETHAHNYEVPSSNQGHDIQPNIFGIRQLSDLTVYCRDRNKDNG